MPVGQLTLPSLALFSTQYIVNILTKRVSLKLCVVNILTKRVSQALSLALASARSGLPGLGVVGSH